MATDGGTDGYNQLTEIFGHLYLDDNNNGMQDAGEEDLADVDVVVTQSDGSMITATSDANGDWTTPVLPGTTSADVDETDPDYPTGSDQTEGDDPTVTVVPARSNTDGGTDGYYTPAEIFGHLYLDENGNGMQDLGEPDLPGVDVIITQSDGSMITLTTDGNGDWSSEVLPGVTSADVDETDPEYPTGYDQTEGDDPTVVITIAGMATDGGTDGYNQLTEIFGHLYLDDNNNGMQDAGEEDLADVDVVVTQSDGSMITVTSDADGDWTTPVLPGTTSADVDETDPDYPVGSDQTEGDDPTVTVVPARSNTDGGTDGYYTPAAIFGHLYLDENGNGMQDLGEPDLPGVDVIITQSDGSMITLTTDGNGDWSSDVLPGITIADIDETDPDYPTDYAQTEGDDPTTVDAIEGVLTDAGNDGFYNPTTIFGHLYLDIDGNNMQDPGEPDLADVDVVITQSDGSELTVTSDANGDWNSPILPGVTTSNVDEMDPDFPTFGTPPTPLYQTEGTDMTTITAIAGMDNDGGIDGYSVSEMCGLVYLDGNGNGMQDPAEMGIQAVDVVITDSQGNMQTVTTSIAADGSAGEFCAVVPPGPTIVEIDTNDPDFPPGTMQSEGTNPTTVNAVGFQTNFEENNGFSQTGDIFGHVYYDDNNNGVQDSGEPNLGNIDVIVTDANGLMQTVVTDANGDWLATVVAGTASADVDETDPDHPAGSVQTEGTDPTSGTAIVNMSVDFGNDGYYIPTSVFGHLYLDENNNGVQDPGEPDLADVDVIITDANGDVQTATSRADGNWSAQVPPGTVIADVDETDPEYPMGSTQTEGTEPTVVTAPLGQNTDAGIDGYYTPSDLFGHVYYDANNNGTQDAGEPDLPNVDVNVTQSDGSVIMLTTDENGNYTTPILPGSTTVEVVTTSSGYPSGADQTEGNNPTTVMAIAGMTTDAGIDGYYRCLSVETAVLLEGSLIDNVGGFLYESTMRTSFNDNKVLPGQTYVDPLFGQIYFPPGQPYDAAPWNYSGTEGDNYDSGGNAADADAGYPADVTDWVLVSLRTEESEDSEVCKAAALLRNDGAILFVEEFDCCSDPLNEYYIVIEHRNHLNVMSNEKVAVVDGMLVYDFRAQDSYIGGIGLAEGQKEISTTDGSVVWALIGGNGKQATGAAADGETDVNVNDKIEWEANNNLFAVYIYSDYNMSGDTNVNDKTLWEENNGKFSSVPQ